ncbi:hypothetical protein GCM10009001_10820 [Virgibacillus siamensis]|uniref:dTDP-4-dehydrorhamnose reductase n=1 Tax=Virgibacillus siamensis TaxID=480071 RepID=A0ABN1FS30_9BACI
MTQVTKKKVIIFGASGTIGSALAEALLKEDYEVFGTFNHQRPINLPSKNTIKLPIEKPELLDQVLSKIDPDFVVMALRGDFQTQLTFHSKVAEFLKDSGGRMFFCSTTNVFDALTDSPHDENDTPMSESEYGRFKIQCETTMMKSLGDKLTIVRIPTILGRNTPRIKALRKNLEEDKFIKLYTNLYGARNSDNMLAKQIKYLMNAGYAGIFHLVTNDIMNHSEFTKKLIHKWGYSYPKFEDAKQETFSSTVPETFYFALQSNKTLPKHLQIDHDQLIDYLSD